MVSSSDFVAFVRSVPAGADVKAIVESFTMTLRLTSRPAASPADAEAILTTFFDHWRRARLSGKEAGEAIDEFARARHRVIVDRLDGTKELLLANNATLQEILSRQGNERTATSTNFYRHVVLPPHYVPRAPLMEHVCSVLIPKQPTGETANNVGIALHGMAGAGKTILARAVCDLPEIQEAFPDGILWATLGRTANETTVIQQLKQWLLSLGGAINEAAPSIETLVSAVAERAVSRRCLFIVDDVWSIASGRCFSVVGVRSRMLITTRDAEIAYALGLTVVATSVMTEEESVRLLTRCLVGPAIEIADVQRRLIVRRLGYLPLAIRLAGSNLRSRSAEQWLADFSALKLRSRRPEGDVHDSLEQAFAISLEALSPIAQRLYTSLAILAPDDLVNEAAVMTLWRALGTNRADAEMFLDDLLVRALLEEVTVIGERFVHMHNLLHEFISARLQPEVTAMHRALVNEYRKAQAGDGWYSAPDDGYLYDHLVQHLLAADEAAEAIALFNDDQWMGVRVPQRDFDHDGYLADLAVVTSYVTAADAADGQESGEMTMASIAALAKFMLIQTSINSLGVTYVPEVVTQAVSTGIWGERRALGFARRSASASERASLYAALLQSSSVSDEVKVSIREWCTALLREAGDATASVLQAVGSHVSGPSREAAIDRIIDDLARGMPAMLGEQLFNLRRDQLLNEPAVRRVFPLLQTIPDDHVRAEALSVLAPELPGDLVLDALEAANAMPDTSNRLMLLAALLSALSEDRRNETARMILQGLDKLATMDRARVLHSMSADVPDDLLPEVLEAILSLPETDDAAREASPDARAGFWREQMQLALLRSAARAGDER